jgi:RNA polymerase sigma-70 factor, ECF subfamily
MGQERNGHSANRMALPASTAERKPAEVLPGTPADLGPHQLFGSHLPFVWRNLRRLGVPDSLVEDAAQDVFLVVHRRWQSWQAERSSIETWLFGIVLRVAHNHRRAQRRRLAWLLPSHEREVQEAASPADGPVELLARREAVAIFERALVKMDEDKRAVFLMIDVEQMTVPEAAAALGINLNTAYWRLRKARMAFRGALARLRIIDNDEDRRRRP